jgi:Ice-binding-like/Bacterial Ig-like domain
MNLKKVFPIVALLLIVFLAGCNKKDKITGVSPEVTSTDPISEATNIAIGSKVSAIFSVAMDPSTMTTDNFSLMIGSTPVDGAVAYTGNKLTFTPAAILVTASMYTGKITTGAKDADGLALAKDYSWNFTTGGTPDITKPTVTLTSPLNNATGVLLNKLIVVTFSKAMDPTTVTALTYSLNQGTTSVAGAVSTTSTTATFTPTGGLAYSKVYTLTVTTGAKDLSGNALAVNYTSSFTTVDAPDTALPMVNATDPLNNATGITANKVVSLTFSEAMTASTINSTTFTLKQGTNAVAGTVAYSGLIATFTPTSALLGSTIYTATITTGAKDLAGNALAANTVWLFTTGAAPTVLSTDPATTGTNVTANKVVKATFSLAMDPLTLTQSTFTLKQGTTPVAGAVTYTGTTASFTATSNFLPGTVYTATIATGAKSVSGFPLSSTSTWSFTTDAAPTVTAVDPTDLAIDILLNKVVTATFSVPMNQSTITATTFTVKQGTNSVAGAVTYAGSTASFTPTSNLVANTLYTATVTTGAMNVSGFPLASNYVWSFTTANPVSVGGVNLGTAANYVIFSNTAIANPNANSTITGNIGTGPGVTSTAITGFSLILPSGGAFSTSSQVVGGGKVYAFDYAVPTPTDVNTASNDMLTAYNDAAGRAPSFTELYAGDISGKTLVPGVYKWSNSVVVNTDVTLSGSSTDVWIFEIAGDLNIAAGGTLPSGIKVALSGGALASNVYWQVGGPTGAVLGTYSTFNGIILSAKQIIMNTGAVMNGKALAQTQVSLDANVVQ